MNKLNFITSLILTAAFSSVAYAGPSAKFAADWETNNVTLAAANCNELTALVSCSDGTAAEELLATIKVPQKKELLIGVSGEARLITLTEAKGKSTDAVSSKSIADTDLFLEVRTASVDEANVCNTAPTPDNSIKIAAPGKITLASRYQELEIDVDLTGTVGDLVSAVTVGLTLDTVAAHHFNFVAPNLDSGEYKVYACFTGTASVTADIDGAAGAFVAIQKRMLTVQEVRAVNSDFVVE